MPDIADSPIDFHSDNIVATSNSTINWKGSGKRPEPISFNKSTTQKASLILYKMVFSLLLINDIYFHFPNRNWKEEQLQSIILYSEFPHEINSDVITMFKGINSGILTIPFVHNDKEQQWWHRRSTLYSTEQMQ